jgi:2'-5' RNA ligase
MATLRCFVAVEASPEVRGRAQALVRQLKAADADVKWIEPDHMHWTLKFLGAVPERDVPEVCYTVTAALRSQEAFEFHARQTGVFPHLGRPRTLWLGGGNGTSQMVALAGVVEDALAKVGYRPESRRFEPHLTIGRVRSGRNVPALADLVRQNEEYDAGVTIVDEVVVFASDLRPTGPVYDALCRVEF